MTDVAVAIASFRRPRGLARALAALERQITSANVIVVVADNDAEKQEAYRLCQQLAPNYRWMLKSIVVPARGIAQARNALCDFVLEHTEVQLVAMFDDDEWPDEHWLQAFIDAQQKDHADALHGTIRRNFETRPSSWAVNCQGVADLARSSGPVAMIEGTGNTIFTRDCLERLPRPYFDPAFALTGGEDRDFFTRLRALGCRFAWLSEAVIYAHVPTSRLTLKWILSRAYRVGNSDMRVFLKHPHSAPEFCREAAKILAALLLFPALLLIFGFSPNHRAEPLCKLYRNAGKVAALFGSHYNEYAVTHGA